MGGAAESMVSILRLATALLFAARFGAAATVSSAHPLHTTLTEVELDATTHTVRVMVRVFGDDFGTALARHMRIASPPVGRAWDDAATSYLGAALAIADRANKPITLHSCGTRRSAELLWICLEGATTETANQIRGRNSILCDLFDDQVNIVQFSSGAEKHSVLFTRGDGLKRLS
jgi:hypothetical protein